MGSYQDQIEVVQKKALLLQEQLGLLERLAEIQEELGEEPTAEKEERPRRRERQEARPRRKETEAVDGQVKRGPGRPRSNLPTLLVSIGEGAKRPLDIADFVKLARAAGYKTKAKDFSNMVYQCLLKLCKQGSFRKDDETRLYSYTGQAAAA